MRRYLLQRLAKRQAWRHRLRYDSLTGLRCLLSFELLAALFVLPAQTLQFFQFALDLADRDFTLQAVEAETRIDIPMLASGPA